VKRYGNYERKISRIMKSWKMGKKSKLNSQKVWKISKKKKFE
jgi:hypothetical protein